mmetsp:Transcript_18469/g.43856  ORF Transcript_18469/g.43856 Transcript_18469/m.43856 type:complete len:209 (+) Transcript_18469:203-829(+)
MISTDARSSGARRYSSSRRFVLRLPGPREIARARRAARVNAAQAATVAAKGSSREAATVAVMSAPREHPVPVTRVIILPLSASLPSPSRMMATRPLGPASTTTSLGPVMVTTQPYLAATARAPCTHTGSSGLVDPASTPLPSAWAPESARISEALPLITSGRQSSSTLSIVALRNGVAPYPTGSTTRTLLAEPWRQAVSAGSASTWAA